MSLDKAVKYGKEHRKPYRGSKAVDRTCCNHGTCKYCENRRLFASRKRIESMESQVIELVRLRETETG